LQKLARGGLQNMKLKGLALAALFFVGTLMAPVQFSYSQTSPDVKSFGPPNLASIPSFTSGVVLLLSGSTAGEIIRMKLEQLDAGDVTNLGLSVSEAAKLHQLLNDASKEERKDFKELFHEFKKAVKLILKIGQGNTDRELNHFSKQAIKLDRKIAQLDAKDEVKDKIKYELKLSQKIRELQRIKNHIATLDTFLDDPENDEALAKLKELKEESYRNILLLKATKKGKDLSEKDLQKIDNKVDKKITPKSKDKKDKEEKASSSEGKEGKDKKSKVDKSGKDKGKKDKKDKKEKKSKSKGGKK